mgnify:CR=1 FL=1
MNKKLKEVALHEKDTGSSEARFRTHGTNFSCP